MTTINPTTFWERIDILLGRKSLRGLCESSGIRINSVYTLRRRNQMPDIDQLLAFSEYFGVSLDYLATGRGQDRSGFQPKVKEVADLLEADPSKLSLVRLALGLTP